MPSPLDLELTGAALKGAPPAAAVGPAASPAAASPLGMALSAPAGAFPGPTTGQLARAAWNQGGQTLQVGPLNTHIPLPQWLEHRLIFQGRALHDVGQGLDNAVRWVGDKLTGQPYQAPAQTAADSIMAATERQHPAYNYLVKYPTEMAASLPLGEGLGELAGKAASMLPLGSGIVSRALPAIARSAGMGAAYGVQQPQGNPAINAGVGAAVGPLFEGGARLAGKGLGLAADAAQSLRQKFFPKALTQDQVDAQVGGYLRSLGVPASVTPKPTPEGVVLSTAAHSDNPRLLDLQAKERAGGNAVPFHELAVQNDTAIANGIRGHLAPNADSAAVSSTAHDLLLSAQQRAKSAVRAAYQPFDEAKGGVYLERAPIQRVLRDAYDGLLPAHREGLPAKLREVIEADHPLHLTSDIEDLSARLNDTYRNAKPGTTASRAASIMRAALDKGVDDAPLANQPELGALTYDPARAPLPRRNMAGPDETQDSILQWLAKHPRGIDSVEAAAQGLDPADFRSGLARVGIRRAFRQGGLSFDQAAEALHQAGYPVADEAGRYDPNVLLNAIDSELRGRPVYSMANTRHAAEMAHEAATAMPPTREPPDLTDLAARAVQVSPEHTQAILDSWTDDTPETLARVQQELHGVLGGAAPSTGPDAGELWKVAKGANAHFRERFPQPGARSTEGKQWLARRLLGLKSPTRFLSEALTTPDRAQAVLDALSDTPAEREQMRGLMRNHYVNRLLANTRAAVPGAQLLNAEALARARAGNTALERVLLNPRERDMLDRYVQAAGDNAKILQRSVNGSSETASLLKHQAQKSESLPAEVVARIAAHAHPGAGILAHVLPALARAPDTSEALQRSLMSALLDPAAYNRIAGAPEPQATGIVRLLRGLGGPAQLAATRPAMFAVPRALGPALSGAR